MNTLAKDIALILACYVFVLSVDRLIKMMGFL